MNFQSKNHENWIFAIISINRRSMRAKIFTAWIIIATQTIKNWSLRSLINSSKLNYSNLSTTNAYTSDSYHFNSNMVRHLCSLTVHRLQKERAEKEKQALQRQKEYPQNLPPHQHRMLFPANFDRLKWVIKSSLNWL